MIDAEPDGLGRPTRPGSLVPAPGPSTPRRAVRRRTGDGSSSDVVGHVLARTGAAVVVLPEDRPPEVIALADIVASRGVPPRRVRPTSSAADLQRLAARGWPGVEQARLGGWLLRAGHGWSARANSCLVAGDPGVSFDDAVAVVADAYVERGLAPRLQIIDDGAAPTQVPPLAGRTWAVEQQALVLVADLRRLDLFDGEHLGDADDGGTVVTEVDRPDVAWLGLYRGGSAAGQPGAVAVLTSAPATYITVCHGDVVVACARVAHTDDWAGLSCVEVLADRRGQGWGRSITLAALARARHRGARFAYLQVEADNMAALRLYEQLGFARHHAYHYLRALD